jgi:hypothetical protein
MRKIVENAPRSPEMKNFDDALKRGLRVSKDELKERLAQEEASKAGKPKRGPKKAHKRLTTNGLPTR